MDANVKAIAKWLMDRGWRKNRLGWWYMPVPGWGGQMVVVGQEIFTVYGAFERQRNIDAGRFTAPINRHDEYQPQPVA